MPIDKVNAFVSIQVVKSLLYCKTEALSKLQDKDDCPLQFVIYAVSHIHFISFIAANINIIIQTANVSATIL